MADARGFFDRLRGLLKSITPADCHPELQARCTPAAIEALDRFLSDNGTQVPFNPDWKESESGKRILELGGAEQLSILFAAFDRVLDSDGTDRLDPQGWLDRYSRSCGAKAMISLLLRKPLPYGESDLELMVRSIARHRAFRALPVPGVLRVISRRADKSMGMSPALREALSALRGQLRFRLGRRQHPGDEENAQKIDRILSGDTPPSVPLNLEPGEAWSDAAIADLGNMSGAQRWAWMDLLLYCKTADGTKPSKKWLAGAAKRVAAVGERDFSQHASSWFSLLEKPRTQRKPPPGPYQPDANLLIEDGHADILKGLAWSCSGLDDPQLARAVGDAATAAFKKVPMFGPKCVRLGNAAVIALAAMPGQEPTAQLGRLSTQVKHASVRRYVGKGLRTIANRTGQSEEDIAELAVPRFGLDAEGKLRRELGEFIAEIVVGGLDEVRLDWRRGDGKQVKSVPAEVKRDHADAVKDLNRTVKDIRKMLPAQRVRLDRLLLGQRQWSVADWRARYADHPLLADFTRRLIWEFSFEGKTQTGILYRGSIVYQDNQPLGISPETRVSLWHPIRSTPQQVLAWRRWLQEQQITQPFKQAHREIYILTDAETQTVNYSNRFAGHILRQHQMAALAQARGWTYRLQGSFDSHNCPTLRLPQHDLRIEYWVEPANEQEMSASYIFLYVATDQVRFYRLDGADPLRVADVDPLLFTEVMRDIDLFVGVASLGNDPAWQDRGDQRFNHYWQEYSRGELGESAKTRKAVLEGLIPRLKIAPRCSFTDRFLVVRGDLHTYKIHLGSANILMEPNNQYLCIVPERSKVGGNLFLPFEGDGTLSVIISKAFLLANDSSITDPSIVRQIGR